MRARDLPLLLIILAISLGIRMYAPWEQVFGQGRVDFLETDAWYHVRVIEHQVRNFPHHLTDDPYATPGGMYVPLAPLFDTIVATVVWATAGSQAPTTYIERVAALAPPIMGTLAVLAVYLLGVAAFDRRAALMGALLAAILPGHFLDRTLVGFVDHHALEALLSISTLAALAWAIAGDPRKGSPPPGAVPGSRLPVTDLRAGAAGLCLGAYLLAWGSGSFLVAILALWTVLTPLVARERAALARAGRIGAIAAVVAWLMILAFQDPGLYRYNTQVASLAGWLALSLVVWGIGVRGARVFYVVLGVAAIAALVVFVTRPGLAFQVRGDLARFFPDTGRMAVLEARPLFLYSGNWAWLQPWLFFRSGFYLGVLGTVLLAASAVRARRLDHALVAIFSASMIAATIGQNRFGYYLVPAVAVVIGWLSSRVLDWGGVPHAGHPSPAVRPIIPLQREAAVVLVAGLAVAPNLVPAALTTARTAGMPRYWSDAMQWLRTSTPLPFASEEYYDQRYSGDLPRPAYAVMNWWDQGYWIMQTARRVPVSNPTQINADAAGAFYSAGDEDEALTRLRAFGARYVLVDWELPFRDGGGGALAGRFENLVNWAGLPTASFYELCYVRAADDWRAVWLFHEPYYRSMAYRLMVLGGVAAEPVNAASVVRTESRTDVNGLNFCELVERRRFPTLDEARRAAETSGGRVVGLDPWQPAFPVPALTRFRQVFEARTPGQPDSQAPMVRIFQVVD